MIRAASRVDADALLGIGLYAPSEAAFYARVSTQLMTRWIHGNKQGSPVVEAEIARSNDKIVTFLDFVQASWPFGRSEPNVPVSACKRSGKRMSRPKRNLAFNVLLL